MRLESNTTFRPQMPLYSNRYARVAGPIMAVDENEAALNLQEGYAMDRAGQDRRYQVVTVATHSGNALAAFWWDLGPAGDFVVRVDDETYPMNPYHQWAEWELSVAELRFAADMTRDDDFGPQLLHEHTQESRIIKRYWELLEEDKQLVANRSTFGPGGATQRNGYTNAGARRQQELAAEQGRYPTHGY